MSLPKLSKKIAEEKACLILREAYLYLTIFRSNDPISLYGLLHSKIVKILTENCDGHSKAIDSKED